MEIRAPVTRALRLAVLQLVPGIVFALSLALLWAAQTLRLEYHFAPFPVPIAGLLLILAADVALWRRYDRELPRWRQALRDRGLRVAERILSLAPLAARIAIWTGLYWALVEDPARIGDPDQFRSWQGQARFVWSWLILVAEAVPPATLVAAAAWTALYFVVVARRRVLRGTVFFLAGPALLWLLTSSWYHGWMPTMDADAIASQPGVRVLFDPRTLEDGRLKEVWDHPRDLQVDEATRVAYVSFGATIGGTGAEAPNLWRIDLATAGFRTLDTRQVRTLAMIPGSPDLYAFPWFTHEVLKIDRQAFTIEKRIDYRDAFPAYVSQPSDVVVRPPWVFVSMCYLPVILRLDLREDRVTDVLDLRADGLLETGSLCCHFAHDADAGRIFFTANRNDRNLVGVIDADRFVVTDARTLPLDPRWIVRAGSGRNRSIYIVDDFNGDVVALSEKDLATVGRCDTSPRSILRVDPVSQRLLQVDPLRGTLTFRTPDCAVERTVFVGPKPYGVFAGDRGIYVVSGAGLVMVQRDPEPR